MSKTLLATTAIFTLLSAPAFAQDTTINLDTSVSTGVEASAGENNDGNAEIGADADANGTVDLNNQDESTSLNADLANSAILATDLLGQNVHTSASADVQVVGDVNDVVMDDEGNADWIIVGVGGFLGFGEKEIAISADQVAWAEVGNEQIVVTTLTKADLEAAEQFNRAEIETSGQYTADDLSWTAEGEARLSAEQQQ